MTTVAEAIAAVEAAERARAARAERSDKFKKFYSSRAWRTARYQFLKTQLRPLRCKCCGADSTQTRIVCDHVISVKRDWSRRLDPSNFQLLCTDCNLAKASRDQTDWRASDAGPLLTIGETDYQTHTG
jgi:5-methylcytosine-specific restriction endonuclease McrA